MLLHKEFVDKIYQYQNLVKELEKTMVEIQEYILKDIDVDKEEKNLIWNDIQRILEENSDTDQAELAIAELDLILAKLRVKTLSIKNDKGKEKKVLQFNEVR